MLDDSIKSFGEILKGHIDDTILCDAIKYIDKRESLLGFETICDYMCEIDFSLNNEQLQMMLYICKELNQNTNLKDGRYSMLISNSESKKFS